ncbi:MAG: hypothetical protein AAB131_10015 [Actinomycetota bacterium]
MTDDDLAVARRLTLDELRRHSTDPAENGWPDWPDRLATMLASADWITAMLEEIRTNGPNRQAAFIVISRQPTLAASVEDFELLRRLLIDVVRDGGDECGLESMARLVDSPSLRTKLEQLLEEPDEEVRRRAWWARNAIRRAHEPG